MCIYYEHFVYCIGMCNHVPPSGEQTRYYSPPGGEDGVTEVGSGPVLPAAWGLVI